MFIVSGPDTSWENCFVKGEKGRITNPYQKDFFTQRFRFGSDQEGIDMLAHEISAFLDEKGYGHRGGEMFMAVNELAINIAEHSHHYDPNTPIYIGHWRTSDRVYISVGGKPSHYDVGIWHRDDTHAIQKRGWGTKLTRSFADLIVLDQDLSGVLLGFDLERRVS